ncbi:MAG: hypothetical protein KF727_02485 [Microbacteriaceae bacterium]|nr:hypothetical protein [Microbacteriaceae bacterium]
MPEREDDVPEEAVRDEAAPGDAVPEGTAPDETARDEFARPAPGRARRYALVGARMVAGTVGIAAAAATIAAVGLVPWPTRDAAAPGVEVTPVPADQLRVCAGSALRLGDETGENAGTPVVIGLPSVRADAEGGSLDSAQLPTSDAGNGGAASSPRVLRLASDDAAQVAGAQGQQVDASSYLGYQAASCAEPSGSIWLVGGATTVGRTSILTIANPTEVSAQVTLELYGEEGRIDAPGMNGIDVPAGSQRVLSLAGFAPGLASPVVHIVARGGQVVAYLQQSVVRGLDATGVDLVDAAPDPATDLAFPGVRVVDALATQRAMALEDWDDVVPAVRILNPGTTEAQVTVGVTAADPAVEGTGFTLTAEPGVVTEVALDSGIEADTGVTLADGVYTVTVTSEVPVVAGVRVSAAADIGPIETEGVVEAPVSDFAWYTAAPALQGDALVTVPPGPEPVLAVVNPGDAEVALSVEARGGTGADFELAVPAGGTASAPLVPGTTYLLRDAAGLRAAVSYASDEAMAAYPVLVARPVSGSIVIRP